MTFACSRGHSSQCARGTTYGLSSVGWQLAHAAVKVPSFLLLLRRHVLENFHSLQNSATALFGQVVEFIEPFAKLVLPITRQLLELRIAFELFLLFLCRDFPEPAQPVSHVRPGTSKVGR